METAPYIRNLRYPHTCSGCPSKLAPAPLTVKKSWEGALHICHLRDRSLKFSFWGGGRLKGLFGKDRVCAVVAGETARKMRSQVRLGLQKTRTLELRLDYLRNAKERETFLSSLRRKRPRAVLIATCRRQEGGGLFQGTREKQIEILAQAARSGCEWCDVEIETVKRIARGELLRALSPARVMVSYHDFRGTPRNLAGIVRRLERAGGQAIKIAA